MFIDEHKRCYVGDCMPGDREATAEEESAWELSLRPTPQEQIDKLEHEELLPRSVREFMLLYMEINAPAEVLAVNHGYRAVKAFDERIKALRSQL